MIRGTRQKQTTRTPRRRSVPSARRAASSRRASSGETAHRSARRLSAKAGRKAVPKPVQKPKDIERETALKNFGTAIRYFQRRDYAKAVALFEKVAAGPVREVAERARIHLRFCEHKRHHERRPKTAEGFYARGVAALNSRDFDQALEYLIKSDKMVPNQEYIHYALAAAYGLQGDPDKAFSHLEKAIRLRPQNRIQARQDEDFQALAGDPRFTRLLGEDDVQQLVA